MYGPAGRRRARFQLEKQVESWERTAGPSSRRSWRRRHDSPAMAGEREDTPARRGGRAGVRRRARHPPGAGRRGEPRAGKDLRYGARILHRSPRFTVAVVLILGLGVGVAMTTTVFAIVDSLLLNAVPFAELHRLVVLNRWDRAVAVPCSRPRWWRAGATRRRCRSAGCRSPSPMVARGRSASRRLRDAASGSHRVDSQRSFLWSRASGFRLARRKPCPRCSRSCCS